MLDTKGKDIGGTAVFFQSPLPEELARRKKAVAEVLAMRALTPSIAPLTTADLVHMARADATWYGSEDC